jgi:hypothetical protein
LRYLPVTKRPSAIVATRGIRKEAVLIMKHLKQHNGAVSSEILNGNYLDEKEKIKESFPCSRPWRSTGA